MVPCPTAGVSGTAYPVVAVTPRGVIVNRNNGVNITGDFLPPFDIVWLPFEQTALCLKQSPAAITSSSTVQGPGHSCAKLLFPVKKP
jgi:hypothetical protein